MDQERLAELAKDLKEGIKSDVRLLEKLLKELDDDTNVIYAMQSIGSLLTGSTSVMTFTGVITGRITAGKTSTIIWKTCDNHDMRKRSLLWSGDHE